MSNELLFITISLVDLAICLFACRMGRNWLYVFIAANLIVTNLFAPKIVPVFGVSVSLSAATIATIYVATDILTEHYGKTAGFRAVWLSFFSVVLVICLGQIMILSTPAGQSAEISGALREVFAAAPRNVLASMTAYILVQRYDIWIYHLLHEKMNGRYLWLRNNVSTLTSQFFDTVIFFTIAFAGKIPVPALINIILFGYIVKAGFAVFDTPFIYLSYWVRGKSLRDTREVPVDEPRST